MKKFKIMPAILMLVMCVAVLTFGVLSIIPNESQITAIITINPSASPIKLQLFIDNTNEDPIAVYNNIKEATTIDLVELLGEDGFAFNTEDYNYLHEVPAKKIILRVTNLASAKQLGAYYLTEELSESTLIQTTHAVYDNEDSTKKMANVVLPSYTVIHPNNAQSNNEASTKDLTIEFNAATWEEGLGNFNYYLYVEEMPSGEQTEYEKTTNSKILAPEGEEVTAEFVNSQITTNESINVVVSEGVKTIGANAFNDKCNYTSLTLPLSTTTIGASAFNCCCNIKTLTIPENVTTIGAGAFIGCEMVETFNYNAKNVVSTYNRFTFLGEVGAGVNIFIGNKVIAIPSDFLNNDSMQNTEISSVTFLEGSSCKEIGGSAFMGCSNLNSIVLPNTVMNIGSYAFYGCYGVETLIIPSSVINIEDDAFGVSNKAYITASNGIKYLPNENGDPGVLTSGYNCTEEIVTIAPTCTIISSYAFYYNSKIKIVNIPNSVLSIGVYAFHSCSNLEEVYISGSLKNISNEAFARCGALKKVVIDDGVTDLGTDIFSGCTSLKEVVIPDSITRLRGNIFMSCSGLTSIVLPSSIEKMENIFMGCTGLTEITVLATMPPELTQGLYSGIKTVYVPHGCLEAYQTADGWKDLNVTFVELDMFGDKIVTE